MKRTRSELAKHFVRVTAVGLTALSGGKVYYHAAVTPEAGTSLSLRQFSFGRLFHEYENVLGTSMELIVRAAHPGEAQECEIRVLEEIERLRRILSTYDPSSEICHVMAGGRPRSPELEELFALYAQWNKRTAGAININMGKVARLWQVAATTGVLPTPAQLRTAAVAHHALNVDALGKGFIIDRAVAAARRFAPAGLLNIGGDIRVWGRDSWLIGVSNPGAPAENAAPLAQFHLREGAVATSGGYARNFTVTGRLYSHVIDPRSQWPTPHLASATVVAADCVTANALSTAICVLGPIAGAPLARRWGALEHLIVDAVGRFFHTTAFASATTPEPAKKNDADKPAPTPAKPAEPAADKPVEKPSEKKSPATAWLKDYQVTINVTLKTLPATGNRGVKRPYVAIWVQNAEGKHVRTVAVWGNSDRWLPQLSEWWEVSAEANFDAIKSVTRATRPAGQYSVIWDGLDDKGQKVPAGDYKILIEINREHGRHLTESALLACRSETKTADLHETPESDASKITYGPVPTPAAAAPLAALTGKK
jgi:thiamine biosynthesis lipoprotein ApbE